MLQTVSPLTRCRRHPGTCVTSNRRHPHSAVSPSSTVSLLVSANTAASAGKCQRQRCHSALLQLPQCHPLSPSSAVSPAVSLSSTVSLLVPTNTAASASKRQRQRRPSALPRGHPLCPPAAQCHSACPLTRQPVPASASVSAVTPQCCSL
jgi:hypothetical protein